MSPCSFKRRVDRCIALAACWGLHSVLFPEVGVATPTETSSQSDTKSSEGALSQTVLFTSEQAQKGKALFTEHCARCHGLEMEGGQFAPQLRGFSFVFRWAGKPVSEFFSKITTTMPPGNAGTLPTDDYA